MTFTCSCGKTYTESIPKKEHKQLPKNSTIQIQ